MTDQTEPQLLSDEAMAEIERRLQEVYAKWHSPGYVKRLLDTDIPALCQTVRALQAEKDWLRAAVNNLTDANTALREQLAEKQQRILELETMIDTKAGYL